MTFHALRRALAAASATIAVAFTLAACDSTQEDADAQLSPPADGGAVAVEALPPAPDAAFISDILDAPSDHLAPSPLVASPSTIAFASVAAGGQGTPRSVQIQNVGPTTVSSFLFTIEGEAREHFVLLANGCAAPLPPGQSCSMTVGFSPQGGGSFTAVLKVSAGNNALLSIPLEGRALTAISVQPAAWDFGTIIAGQAATRQFVVQSPSMIALTGIRATIEPEATGWTLINACATAPNTAASCSVTVSFTPTMAGAVSRKLRLFNDTGASTEALLTANAVPAPVLALSPASHDYGSLPYASSSAFQTFTVTASGSNADVLTGLIAVAVPQGFVKTNDNCTGKRLSAAGGTCTVDVAPSSPAGAGAHILKASAEPGGEATVTLNLRRPNARGLVGYWNFDNDLQDFSGHGNHATFRRGRTEDAPEVNFVLSDGKRNKALVLNNVAADDGKHQWEWAKVPDSDSIDEIAVSNQFSITLWAAAGALDLVGDDFNFALSRHERDEPFEHFGIGFLEGRPAAVVHFFYAQGPQKLSPGFHHLAATYDGRDLLVYVDGSQIAVAAIGWPIGRDTTTTIIGGNQNYKSIKEGFDGLLDEVRLYSVALTPQQVMDDMLK